MWCKINENDDDNIMRKIYGTTAFVVVDNGTQRAHSIQPSLSCVERVADKHLTFVDE